MNYQDEIQKHRNILKNEIMEIFNRKNSTAKPNKITINSKELFVVRTDSGDKHIAIFGINKDGSLVFESSLIHGGTVNNLSLDDLSMEQLIRLRVVFENSSRTFHF